MGGEGAERGGTMSEGLSKCCQAPVRVNQVTHDACTRFYVCTKCHKGADLMESVSEGFREKLMAILADSDHELDKQFPQSEGNIERIKKERFEAIVALFDERGIVRP